MSSSQVTSNFEKRLSGLADGASRESVQTISKWVAFNRKKAAALTSVLAAAIESAPTAERKVLYLTVAHEVLVAESSVVAGGGDAKKWDRLADLRSAIGEAVVVRAAEAVRDACGGKKEMMERVRTMCDVWEETGAFGGPTIVHEVRRALAAPPRVKAAAASAAAAAAESAAAGGASAAAASSATPGGEGEPSKAAAAPAAPASAADEAVGRSPEAAKAVGSESAAAETKGASTPTSAEGGSPPKGGKAQAPDDDAASSAADGAEDKDDKYDKDADDQESTKDGAEAKAFDFESEGIPYGKVEPRELLNPCKSIATMQIARELRNDTAVQLSTVLSAVPPEVEEACEKALGEADGDAEAAKVDLDSIPPIPDDVLDLDLEDCLNNVRLYRDIIVKQREARRALIELLIKSRCKFGSDEAAEAFYSMAAKAEQVKRRRVLLSDAMELEGLDFVEDEAGQDDGADDGEPDGADLEQLSWYNNSAAAGGDVDQPGAKRAKIE